MSVKNNSIIDVRNVVLNATVKSKKEALRYLCNLLEENGYITNKNIFLEDVLRRETIGPTGMENGIAIPHGESEVAKVATIAVLRTENDLVWESLDKKPIHLIFLMVVPSTNRNVQQLKMLSHLSAALTHPEVQTKLLNETSRNRFKKILEENEEK
ncbi:PTS Fru IIA [Lactobacillus kimbladii]|uniref:PTS Fru IIA n=1 Tax=Lactobacillus kimbladii TaxID=1218506 RepID=A0A0F4LM57_9LACO|nr:PTS sugar transporter subunit IIA [Lactobacillus kimbladii]KJY59398.1 PTS Fru IIA [Lactobacillus kimbladii]